MFQEIIQLFSEVFQLTAGYFFDLNKRVHWFYLSISILLAFFVYLKTKPEKSFLKYIFQKENYLSQTAFVDYGFLFLNGFVKILIIGSFSYWGKELQFNFSEWMLETFGIVNYKPSVAFLVFCYTGTFLILGDFSYFLLHFIYHKVPFLWSFHKVHHSSTALNPITQYRIHPVELILNNFRFILVLVFLNGIFDYLSSGYFGPKTYLGINVLLLGFNSWGGNLRHSHIKLTYFDWLEKWLISPFQHQIHHSSNKSHYNKNLGSKLAVWDRLFGTLIQSKEVADLNVGLGNENGKMDSFIKNLFSPIKDAFRRRK
jgi:sterol desaturase/sphingolipid hydroxylase (fatty acid hydroxylase superfamily)